VTSLGEQFWQVNQMPNGYAGSNPDRPTRNCFFNKASTMLDFIIAHINGGLIGGIIVWIYFTWPIQPEEHRAWRRTGFAIRNGHGVRRVQIRRRSVSTRMDDGIMHVSIRKSDRSDSNRSQKVDDRLAG
jgi:hypothetical protein